MVTCGRYGIEGAVRESGRPTEKICRTGRATPMRGKSEEEHTSLAIEVTAELALPRRCAASLNWSMLLSQSK